jgi:hypothetical protein
MIPDVSQYLKGFLLPTNLSEARNFVSLAHSSCTYLELYRDYFRADFERSLARNHRHGLVPLPGNAYSIFEVQFLKLVDTQLFPIPEYVFEDLFEENRCFQIPIEPNGFPAIFDEDYWGYGGGDAICDIDLGWQLMFYLGGQLQGEFFDGMFDEPTDGIFALHIEDGQLDRNTLRVHCDECEGPLSYLYLAVALLERDTGTVWLDALRDEPIEDARWCRETVDALVEQLIVSEDIWDKSMRFVRWLEEDVLQHFTEVVHLWNLSLKTKETPHTLHQLQLEQVLG